MHSLISCFALFDCISILKWNGKVVAMGESGGGGVAGVDGGETFFCDVFKRKESIFHKKC